MLKLTKIILFFLSFQTVSIHASDGPIVYMEKKVFEEKIKSKFSCNDFEWINPDNICKKPPLTFEWVNEGSAAFITHDSNHLPGIATTGLLSCTGVTAFTKEGYLALAHITDLTHPKSVWSFLETIDVNIHKPVTLISKTLNENHLIKVKYFIEARYDDICPVIKTLPVYKSNEAIFTCLSPIIYQDIISDPSGISFSINQLGEHQFFFLERSDEKYINGRLDQYTPPCRTYEKLYIHKLPYADVVTSKK